MKAKATAAACALLLTCGAAFAAPTAQQKCDFARITAWKKYSACIENVVAKDAKGLDFDEFAAFAKCRHTYFKTWTGFQSKAGLSGSTCIGARSIDNGDQTVTDNLSGLVWEKKDLMGGVHDSGNLYTWSTGASYEEDGTVFTGFQATLNGGSGFDGSNGWRLPTLVELETIVADFACRGDGLGSRCSCPSRPCVDPALDATTTQPTTYWCASTHLADSSQAWLVDFYFGTPFLYGKTNAAVSRAVRGGL